MDGLSNGVSAEGDFQACSGRLLLAKSVKKYYHNNDMPH